MMIHLSYYTRHNNFIPALRKHMLQDLSTMFKVCLFGDSNAPQVFKGLLSVNITSLSSLLSLVHL